MALILYPLSNKSLYFSWLTFLFVLIRVGLVFCLSEPGLICNLTYLPHHVRGEAGAQACHSLCQFQSKTFVALPNAR